MDGAHVKIDIGQGGKERKRTHHEDARLELVSLEKARLVLALRSTNQ